MTTLTHRWAVVAFLLAALASAVAQPAPPASQTNSVQPPPASQPEAPALVPDQGLTTNGSTTNLNEPPVNPAQTSVVSTSSDMTGPTSTTSGTIQSPLMGTSSFGGPSAFGWASLPPGAALLRWGPVDIHPYLGYSFLYETGVGSQPGQHTGTTANTISEGLSLDLGNYWRVAYGASSAFYSGPGFDDTTSQFLTLSGSIPYKEWLFYVAGTYSETTQPLVETGTETKQDGYGASAGLSRQLGSRLSFNAGISESYRAAQQFNDISAWSGSLGLNYLFNSQLTFGLSLGGGYDSVSQSEDGGTNSVGQATDVEFEQLQAFLVYHPGQKLTLSLSGGAEQQQFVGANSPSMITPIFSASAGYVLFKSTLLSISAARAVSPSYFANEDSIATTLTVGLQQRLTEKLSLTVSGGYTDSTFISIEPGTLPRYYVGLPTVTPLTEVRSDTGYTLQANLNYTFDLHLGASAYWSIGQNTSSQGNFSYSSSQVGFQLSYRY